MSDYSMVGSFNTGNASSLNGDLITKLREADEKSIIAPIDTRIESWDEESVLMDDIEAKANEFLETIKLFDLFSTDNNAFEQITANTTGTAAVFDASDIGALEEGEYNVHVETLAQKDVFQSSIVNSTNLSDDLDAGDFKVQIGTGSFETFDTTGLTLEELAQNIDLADGLSASVEQVGDTDYRLVIKSTDTGLENALTFDGAASESLGFTDRQWDGSYDEAADTNTLRAQNLVATVDGVEYDVSSNSITVDGNLKITATEVGDASISIVRDDSYVVPAVEEIALKYNELVTLINDEIYADDSSIQDKSSLRGMLSDIKNMFYKEYSLDNLNPINFGIGFDINGLMTVDTTVLGEALTSDFDSVKNLFLGVAESKGLGTQLKEYIDGLNSYDGLFERYDSAMTQRKENLDEEREKAVATLDARYSLMASQFSAYGAIIAQMEASFSGLQMMIEQSTASN